MAKEQKSVLRVVIRTEDEQALREMLREQPLDLSCGGPRRQQDGTIMVEAYVPSADLDYLRRTGLAVEVLEDAAEVGRERQKQVGVGDRFEGGKQVPRGPGKKE